MKKTWKQIVEKISRLLGAGLICIFIVIYSMSEKRRKKIKRKNMIPSKVNMMNCFPSARYKVVRQPEKWNTVNFLYMDRIAQCVGTDRIYGAKLRFDTGETVSIPFNCLELVVEELKPKIKAPVVDQEVELVKGHYYKVVRKPTTWGTCKYVGEIGKCMIVDDRGARLRFKDANDISFPADCLEQTPAIDLSNVIPQGELDEKDIVQGGLYQVIKAPEKFGEGKQLIGRVGKAKWPNYRGVCIKFADASSYVIPYDCLAKYVPPESANPVPVVKKLNASTIVFGRKYKVKSVPGAWPDDVKRATLNQFAEVKFATDIGRGAMMIFPNKMEKLVPFDCLEDLPRPTESELIDLIKKHPDKLLKIIKHINEYTRLKPVKDFCSTGLLPYCKEEAITVYGPQLPEQHSAALLMHPTVDETPDLMNHVVSMFKADDSKAVSSTKAPIPIVEVAAED